VSIKQRFDQTMGNSTDRDVYHKLLDHEESITAIGKPVIRILSSGDYSSKSPCTGHRVARVCCKTLIVLCFVVIVLVAAVSATAYFWMKDLVDHLSVTADQSKTFPIVPMSEAERHIFQDKVKLFVDELNSEYPPEEPLTITQDEINGFLGHSDYLRGHFYVTLTKNKWVEEYSLPTDVLPGGSNDKFIVGNDYMKFDASKSQVEIQMETASKHEDWFVGPIVFARLSYLVSQDDAEHLLNLFVEQGSFFGKPVSQEFIDKRHNLLEDLYNDPDDGEHSRTIVGHIKSVSIEDGKVVITPRSNHDLKSSTVAAKKVHGAKPPSPYHHSRIRGKRGKSSSSSSDASSSSDNSSSSDASYSSDSSPSSDSLLPSDR